MFPTKGRVVLYRLSSQDLVLAAEKLPGAKLNAPQKGEEGPTYVEWEGNRLVSGDEYPADVVQSWGGECVNLVVKLDGPGTLWVTSRSKCPEGETLTGTWSWPPRVG